MHISMAITKTANTNRNVTFNVARMREAIIIKCRIKMSFSRFEDRINIHQFEFSAPVSCIIVSKWIENESGYQYQISVDLATILLLTSNQVHI